MAFKIADLVISWNTIRLVFSSARSRLSAKCQAMASPSRSSSLANQTISAFWANCFSSFTKLFLSLETIYLGVKSPSTSTPSSLEGKSAICPKLEVTLKSFPKNFSIVLAFAGDSTITKFFAIAFQIRNTKVYDFFNTEEFATLFSVFLRLCYTKNKGKSIALPLIVNSKMQFREFLAKAFLFVK